MANKARGEVDITIAGKSYAVAMTLDAIGRLAEVFGEETITGVEVRLMAMKVQDAVPILAALLAANGHGDLDPAVLKQMPFRSYVTALIGIHRAEPGAEAAEAGAKPDPRKRSS